MQRKLEKARRRAFELVMRSKIAFKQRGVAQDMRLPHSTLHCGDFIRQRTAAVGNLCGLVNSFAAVVSKPVNGKCIVDESDDERQTYKGETEQDQFQERLRVPAQAQHGSCARRGLLPYGFC